MYCKHCGKALPEKSEFCENCGTSVFTGKRRQAALSGRKKKLLLVLSVIAIGVVVGISMLADYLKMCIDPTEYVSISISGLSGKGALEIHFDEHKLLENKIAGMNYQDKQWDESFLENADPLRTFSKMFFGEEDEEISILDPIFSLYADQDEYHLNTYKNGDTVEITIHVNQDLLETYGFHTLKKEYRMTYVIGEDTPLLSEPAYIDIFAMLDLQIVGDDGNGRIVPMGTEAVVELKSPINDITTVTVEITPRDDAYIAEIRLKMLDDEGNRLYSGTVGVIATQTAGLSNDDETVVSFHELDWVLEKGIGFLETEKTFKAAGLSEEGRLDVFSYIQPKFFVEDGAVTVSWELKEEKVGLIGAVQDIYLELQPGSYSGQTLLVVSGKNTKGKDIQCTFELCTTWNPALKNGDTMSAYIAEKGRGSKAFHELGVMFDTTGHYDVSGLE